MTRDRQRTNRRQQQIPVLAVIDIPPLKARYALLYPMFCLNLIDLTTSVATSGAGLGRHGMLPSASNDTGTVFCFPNKEEAEMRRTDDVSF